MLAAKPQKPAPVTGEAGPWAALLGRVVQAPAWASRGSHRNRQSGCHQPAETRISFLFYRRLNGNTEKLNRLPKTAEPTRHHSRPSAPGHSASLRTVCIELDPLGKRKQTDAFIVLTKEVLTKECYLIPKNMCFFFKVQEYFMCVSTQKSICMKL